MNIAEQAQKSLSTGFASIVEQFQLPSHFPPEVVEEADKATRNVGADRPAWMSQRRDATDIPFVTLDPASSTDLDQAFAIEQDGAELVLHYALADVSAFVSVGSVIENEAWQRGVTIYGLAEKIPLYPKVILQWAASLLPVGPRPAVLDHKLGRAWFASIAFTVHLSVFASIGSSRSIAAILARWPEL